jgi:hypothetical protein
MPASAAPEADPSQRPSQTRREAAQTSAVRPGNPPPGTAGDPRPALSSSHPSHRSLSRWETGHIGAPLHLPSQGQRNYTPTSPQRGPHRTTPDGSGIPGNSPTDLRGHQRTPPLVQDPTHETTNRGPLPRSRGFSCPFARSEGDLTPDLGVWVASWPCSGPVLVAVWGLGRPARAARPGVNSPLTPVMTAAWCVHKEITAVYTRRRVEVRDHALAGGTRRTGRRGRRPRWTHGLRRRRGVRRIGWDASLGCRRGAEGGGHLRD